MVKYNEVADNPLKSKKDFQEAVRQLCYPLKRFYSTGGARLHIGSTGSFCSEATAEMEAFSRPLWGLVPLIAGGGESELLEIYIKGIKNGTNPDSEEYWGEIGDKDQLMVEMAVFGLALCMIPGEIWNPLNLIGQQNFAKWLAQINHHIVVDTNWLFFRVLVNLGLKNVKAEYDSEMLEKDLDRLDEFYISDGWYQDGFSDQRDYYIPFAMHYYGLIYSRLGNDDKRAPKYKERAKFFAKDFIYWFSKDAASIPFGRSLTYRFAQSCFWSALVFADVDVLSMGVIKGIICRNLRWWFQQPIFTTNGILSIGYSYPNLNMAEGYNSPGSPYWALKTFLVLALNDDHPFWKVEEEEFPVLKSKSVQKHPYMIICRQEKDKHVIAYTSGQHAEFEPVHGEAKYEKFAYSNIFGFSVPKGNFGLEQGAYDSMLALSEGDNYYRVRRKCEEIRVEEDYIFSRWKPWKDVDVQTWIIPYESNHIRIHKIITQRELDTAEGGFAISRENGMDLPSKINITSTVNIAMVASPWGTSGIINLSGERESKIIRAESNTNLISPRTWIPTLIQHIGTGVHILACLVIGNIDGENVDKIYQNLPSLQVTNNLITIYNVESEITIR